MGPRITVIALAVLALLSACGADDDGAAAPGEAPFGSGGPDGAGGAGGAGAAAYVDFDVNHVLITGQSNSVSNSGIPVLSTTQPFGNLMFDTGVMPMKGGFTNPWDHSSDTTEGCDPEGCTTYEEPTALVPLVEGDKFFDYEVETAGAGLANEISHLATTRHERPKHDVLVSVHGRSGNTYQCLRKGNCDYKPDYLSPFEQAMKDVANGKALAEAQKKTYVVRAVAAIHGESDHYSYSSGDAEFPLNGTDGKPGAVADYSDALIEWQRDYEAGVKEITKQSQPVPLLVSQLSGWNDMPMSRIAQYQLEAHAKAPGKVIVVGPAYPIELDQSDCLHFTNHGVRRLGEYFAKVYAQVVFEGKAWEPVRPKTVTRDGAVITVVFHVPKPPLVIDTEKVAAAPNHGFSFTDGEGDPEIAKVEVAGPDAVKITLAGEPTGAAQRLRYAMNQEPGSCVGTPDGARGNLRDSDDTPSKHGYDLHNWAVNFDVTVP